MKVDGKDIRTIWLDEHEKMVKIIDQRKLPHELAVVNLKTVDDAIKARKWEWDLQYLSLNNKIIDDITIEKDRNLIRYFFLQFEEI